MSSYRARAIVLKHTKLGESDVIVTLLSQDGRQIRVVAKGLRKPGSRFGARLEPYSVVEGVFSTGRNLDIVSDVKAIDPHSSLRNDLEHSAAAAVIVALLERTSLEDHAERMVFDMACAALDVLSTLEDGHLSLCVSVFTVKLMAIHGYRPIVDICPLCAHESRGGSILSAEQGGVLCPACSEGSPGVRIRPELGEWISFALSVRFTELSVQPLEPAAFSDLLEAARYWSERHIGKIKAFEFFENVLLH